MNFTNSRYVYFPVRFTRILDISELVNGIDVYIRCLGHIEGKRWLNGDTRFSHVWLTERIFGDYSRWKVYKFQNSFLFQKTGEEPGTWWLNGNTVQGTVNLAPTTSGIYTGTKWDVISFGEGAFAIYCKGHLEGFRYLDGRTKEGSVGLAPKYGDGFSGALWEFYKA